MALPYTVNYKLPLEYLTLQEWNNFIQNLLFLNQYGSAQLLQYFQNGSFQNLNEVIAKYLSIASLKINGYNALHNLSEPQAYTFGMGNQQPFQNMANMPTVSFPYSIPFEFIQFYPITNFPSYQFPVFPVQNLQVQMSQISKQLQLLVPNLISKITVPNNVAGTQFQFSGSATVQNLIQNYFDPSYLQTWREIMIQNLGNNAVQINNAIYLMPKQCLKITASSPSEIQLTAQSPTLLSETIEFIGTPISTYVITITNNQPNPTPSPFQQLLILNLSSFLSSSSQLLNLQFCLDPQCNTPLHAWISQYNSNLSTVYIWTLLPTSIPANGSLTIYMFLRNSNQYPYTGINAYYNTAYDNGANIFDAYINAMGTSYLPSNLQIYSTVYSSIQFTPQSGTTPGYILMLNQQKQSYTTIYLPTTNANNVNEIFEGIGYYNGSADGQGIGFLGNGTSNIFTGNYYLEFPENSYAIGIDPYYSASLILYNGTQEAKSSNSMFTSSGYNFYQAIVTSSEIEFYGSSISTPIIDLPQLSLQLATSWSSSITSNGSSFGFGDGAGGATHLGQFYWARARKLPPNNVMPSNSQPQQTIVFVG